jgi:hypothetical protein
MDHRCPRLEILNSMQGDSLSKGLTTYTGLE